jgi:hypothetical protein
MSKGAKLLKQESNSKLLKCYTVINRDQIFQALIIVDDMTIDEIKSIDNDYLNKLAIGLVIYPIIGLAQKIFQHRPEIVKY